MSYAYISRIEAGTRTPSARALQALAASFGCTALYLASGHYAGVYPFCGRGPDANTGAGSRSEL
jgi:transcriptional regulator with XRE-family HTH domain